MSDKLEYIKDLMKVCFVPELAQDLDNVPITSDDFQPYHQALNHNLPLLYDFVQQNEWIFNNETREIQEVHACLLILICELAPNTEAVYKFQNGNLIKNANRLLRQTEVTAPVEDIIFSHYRSKLSKDGWKRQLGATHGFLRYLEYRYNEATRSKCQMTSRWIPFCLSVGLNVRECHEPVFKHIGIRIFLAMLSYASDSEIKELNIHSVVYDSVFKDVNFMEDIIATADAWSCLFKCLEFYHDCDSLRWSRVDDMLETLLRNIALTSDVPTTICLMKFITKLCCYFSSNRSLINQTLNENINSDAALERCRCICADNTSYTVFRWAKSILNMFVTESHKLMQSPAVCRELLLEMHRCYMVSILPIILQVTEPLLVPFYEKFTGALMEVMQIQKLDKDIVKLIKNFTQTFQTQLKGSPYCNDSRQLMAFQSTFEALLNHDVFKRVV